MTSTPLPEQGGFNERLDEILAAVYLAGIENGLGRSITDPDEINHSREAFIKANPANREAVNCIRTLIREEIIGGYEKVGLPTTQAQEQSNYDKRIRNVMRDWQIETLGMPTRYDSGGTHGTK